MNLIQIQIHHYPTQIPSLILLWEKMARNLPMPNQEMDYQQSQYPLNWRPAQGHALPMEYVNNRVIFDGIFQSTGSGSIDYVDDNFCHIYQIHLSAWWTDTSPKILNVTQWRVWWASLNIEQLYDDEDYIYARQLFSRSIFSRRPLTCTLKRNTTWSTFLRKNGDEYSAISFRNYLVGIQSQFKELWG